MASWENIQEAVRVAIAAALELADFTGADGVTSVHKVEWQNRVTSHRYVDAGGWADITLGVVQVKGTDEIRYEYAEGDTPEESTNFPTTGGQRDFGVTVRVCAFSQEPGAAAVGYLGGKLRTRMRRLDVLKDLRIDGDTAFVGLGPTISGDYPDHNGRMVSCSVTELRFRSTETDTDTSESAGAWVQSVGMAGEYDGTTLESEIDTAD